MSPILLGHIDEHIIEFLECVIVSIAAEYVRHLFNYLSFICTNVHILEICPFINEQIRQLGRHFIIHDLVHQSYIVIGEEIDSTILCQYTDYVMR